MNAADERYELQLGKMLVRRNAWLANHPEAEVLVQFNFPRTVCVVACISDAIEKKFVSANEAGLELIKALGNWGQRDEPSVLMVRVILEAE